MSKQIIDLVRSSLNNLTSVEGIAYSTAELIESRSNNLKLVLGQLTEADYLSSHQDFSDYVFKNIPDPGNVELGYRKALAKYDFILNELSITENSYIPYGTGYIKVSDIVKSMIEPLEESVFYSASIYRIGMEGYGINISEPLMNYLLINQDIDLYLPTNIENTFCQYIDRYSINEEFHYAFHINTGLIIYGVETDSGAILLTTETDITTIGNPKNYDFYKSTYDIYHIDEETGLPIIVDGYFKTFDDVVNQSSEALAEAYSTSGVMLALVEDEVSERMRKFIDYIELHSDIAISTFLGLKAKYSDLLSSGISKLNMLRDVFSYLTSSNYEEAESEEDFLTMVEGNYTGRVMFNLISFDINWKNFLLAPFIATANFYIAVGATFYQIGKSIISLTKSAYKWFRSSTWNPVDIIVLNKNGNDTVETFCHQRDVTITEPKYDWQSNEDFIDWFHDRDHYELDYLFGNILIKFKDFNLNVLGPDHFAGDYTIRFKPRPITYDLDIDDSITLVPIWKQLLDFASNQTSKQAYIDFLDFVTPKMRIVDGSEGEEALYTGFLNSLCLFWTYDRLSLDSRTVVDPWGYASVEGEFSNITNKDFISLLTGIVFEQNEIFPFQLNMDKIDPYTGYPLPGTDLCIFGPEPGYGLVRQFLYRWIDEDSSTPLLYSKKFLTKDIPTYSIASDEHNLKIFKKFIVGIVVVVVVVLAVKLLANYRKKNLEKLKDLDLERNDLQYKISQGSASRDDVLRFTELTRTESSRSFRLGRLKLQSPARSVPPINETYLEYLVKLLRG